jgi:hypothetical protein
MESTESLEMLHVIVIPVIVVAVTWAIRWRLASLAQALMVQSSDKQKNSLPEVLDVAEVPAKAAPSFLVLDQSTDIHEATEARVARESEVRKTLGRALGYEIVIGLAYVFIQMIMLAIPIHAITYETSSDFSMLVVPFIFISVMRYVLFRNPSRAVSYGVLGFLGNLIHTQAKIADPKGRFAWHILLMMGAVVFACFNLFDESSVRAGISLLLAAGLHYWLLLRMLNTVAKRPSSKLLVLRVFGNDDTMEFTFNGMLDYWAHFGPYFMVADPVLLKMEAKKNSWLIWIVLLLAFFLLILNAVQADVAGLSEYTKIGIASVIVAIGGYLYYLSSVKLMKRRFVHSYEDLVAKVDKLSSAPLNWNLLYKCMPMFCYDNTWKISVEECVKNVDGVLMDLRGYSKEREGCAYEVDYLFDVISTQKVIFIVDDASIDAVTEMIQKKWEFLRTVSPNLNEPNPIITYYQTHKENGVDMQNILDLMLYYAAGKRLNLEHPEMQSESTQAESLDQ